MFFNKKREKIENGVQINSLIHLQYRNINVTNNKSNDKTFWLKLKALREYKITLFIGTITIAKTTIAAAKMHNNRNNNIIHTATITTNTITMPLIVISTATMTISTTKAPTIATEKYITRKLLLP